MTKKTLIGVAATAGLLSFGAAANAVQYSWNLYSTASDSHSLTFKSTPSGGPTLTVSAFRSGSTTDASGALIDAYINPDGSAGLGVRSSGETSPDDYLLDNKGGFDVLVFDSGISGFDWGSIELGAIFTGSGIDSTPGLTYWTGGDNITGGADASNGFNTLCLIAGSGCTNSLQTKGFSAPITLANLSTGDPGALTASAKGRYLVVSGALDGSAGGGYDKFKIKSVPTPQTVSLLGIGLLALLFMRRGLNPAPRDASLRIG